MGKYLIVLAFISVQTIPCLWAQCNSEGVDALCLEQISKDNIFVKSYKLLPHQFPSKEYSSILARDTEYYINLCEQGKVSSQVEINVYNSKRKLVASNQADDRLLPELSFHCKQTGVYYFEFKATTSAGDCGMGALSFRRLSSSD